MASTPETAETGALAVKSPHRAQVRVALYRRRNRIFLFPWGPSGGILNVIRNQEESTMIDVAALGELLIDFTTLTRDGAGYPTMAAHPGGAPANFLAALSKFGAKTALLGKVGDDAFGHLLMRTLEAAGIETRGLVVDPEVFTTLAFVTLDDSGDRAFSFARKPGADTCLRFEELDLSLLDEARAYAKSRGKLITYDPNLRKPLWADLREAKEQLCWGLSQADVVKISDEEVAFLFGLSPKAGADYLLRTYGVKLVFVTCGANGCYFRSPQAAGWVPSLTGIQVADTTGAGDIFGGSAVWKLLELDKAPESLTAEELRDIAAFATAAAGLSTTKPGGISSVPEQEAVLRQIAQI